MGSVVSFWFLRFVNYFNLLESLGPSVIVSARINHIPVKVLDLVEIIITLTTLRVRKFAG
jgi:hypothetical protein